VTGRVIIVVRVAAPRVLGDQDDLPSVLEDGVDHATILLVVRLVGSADVTVAARRCW
jgi:hypothetical protein